VIWELLASHGLLVFALLLGIWMLAALLRQRRSPQSALAWIGFAVLIPYVAVPLFFLVRRRKVPRRLAMGALVGDRPFDPHSDRSRLEALLVSYGVPAATAGNQVYLCTTGEATYASLVELIGGARERIDIAIFILHPDEIGRDVLARLTQKAADGVRVRLLLDGLGSFTTWSRHVAPLRAAGGRVEYFHPPMRPSFWTRANLRNHRKIVVIDAARALAGGINMAREYMGPEPMDGRWTDLAFTVEGPAALDYLAIVESDWCYATGETPQEPSGPADPRSGAYVQIVPSGPDVVDDALQACIVAAAFEARHRLWITTPYFVPDSELCQALCLAARRGVDVRLIVPEHSNHRIADWARGPYLRDLERSGGRILLFEKGMLHAKALLVDTALAMLGSANVDLRSLYLDYEVMMLLYGQPEAAAVATWMQGLLSECRGGIPQAGRTQEIFEGAVRLLAPLL
jgi:cardiolipin synthase A/B